MSLKFIVAVTLIVVVIDAVNSRSVLVQAGSRSSQRTRNAKGSMGFVSTRLRDFIVARHNELRASVIPPAENMEQMRWSMELAEFAKEGVQCKYWNHHRKYLKDYGENLHRIMSPTPLKNISSLLSGGLNHWWNENRNYTYETGSCRGKTCGHYTQMAWASTTEVGCAWRLNCPMFRGGKQYTDTFLLVCNYNPIANYRFYNFATGTFYYFRPYKAKKATHAKDTTTSTPVTSSTTTTAPLSTRVMKATQVTVRLPTSSTHSTPRITTPSPTVRTWATPTSRLTKDDLISCVTFENGWNHMQGMNGLKVKNNGVTITRRGCIHGKCGHFRRGATLEIPFFRNRLTYRSFSVSFFFRSKTGRDGFLSNSCQDITYLALWDDLKLPSRSSLSIGTDNSVINIKMNHKQVALSTTALTDIDKWHHFVLSWDGSEAFVYIDNVRTKHFSFRGPLERTLCSLVIGRTDTETFTGLMDEICFYRTALSRYDVEDIYDRHVVARSKSQQTIITMVKSYMASPRTTERQLTPSLDDILGWKIGSTSPSSTSPTPRTQHRELGAGQTSTAVTTDPPSVLTCVTFEDGWDHVQGTKGIYVKNTGVRVVSGDCVHNNCGYFDGHSFLSMPFFKGNLPEHGFSVSFYFKGHINDPSRPSAVISNQCVRSDWYSQGYITSGGSSLSISLKNGRLGTTLTNEQRDVESVDVPISHDAWHHYALSWDGRTVSVYIDSVLTGQRPMLSGHLNRIICAMHIGLGAAELNKLSFFRGRMDEVCFLKGALSGDDVRKINKDPLYIHML